MLHTSVCSAIGHTPLVLLSRFSSYHHIRGSLLCKLEYLNPGLSKKDRVARQIIVEAIAEGRLRPEQHVVELTSGNTGTGELRMLL